MDDLIGGASEKSNLNFRIALFFAISAHIVILSAFRLNALDLDQRKKGYDFAISVVLTTSQETDESSTDTEKNIVDKNQAVTTGKQFILADKATKISPAKDITTLTAVNLDAESIRNFAEDYVKANVGLNSDSFSSFKASFTDAAQEDRTRYKSKFLIEGGDGIVDVKTGFLGKSICYTFDANA